MKKDFSTCQNINKNHVCLFTQYLVKKYSLKLNSSHFPAAFSGQHHHTACKSQSTPHLFSAFLMLWPNLHWKSLSALPKETQMIPPPGILHLLQLHPQLFFLQQKMRVLGLERLQPLGVIPAFLDLSSDASTHVGGSQTPITSAPGDLISSCSLHRLPTHVAYTYIDTNTYT